MQEKKEIVYRIDKEKMGNISREEMEKMPAVYLEKPENEVDQKLKEEKVIPSRIESNVTPKVETSAISQNETNVIQSFVDNWQERVVEKEGYNVAVAAVVPQNPVETVNMNVNVVDPNSIITTGNRTIGVMELLGNFVVFTSGCGLGYYYSDNEGKLIRFTDFIIVIEYREEKYGRKGKIEENYVVKLINDVGRTKILKTPVLQWIDLKMQIEHEAPDFQIFVDEVRNANDRFRRILGLLIKTRQILIKIIYSHWGWGLLHEGRRQFFHGGLASCESEKILPLPPPTPQDRFNILQAAWGILNVGDHKVIVPSILYSLASYMDALFTDANHPLSHCMMLVGASGTMKTSFSKVVFSPFVPENERVYTVRSTEASLNVLHEKCYDDTLVIDDFNLEGSQAEVKSKMRNIRALIRSYSDRTPRTKYGGNDNVKQYALRGGCVFTGETKMTGQLKSSELRYIKVIFKSRLDGVVLRTFQEQPGIWQSFVAEFIRYLENYYNPIVIYIKSIFNNERSSNLINIKEPRLIDAFLHLRIVAQMMLEFLETERIITSNQRIQWFDYFCRILYDVVSEQEEEAQIQEPYVQYLLELFNLLGTGKLRIARDLDTYVLSMRDYVGYEDNDNKILMLKKDEAYRAVQEAFAARNEYLAISTDEISKLLKSEGLTKCDKNSCLKKAPDKIPGRPRMLAIIVSKCNALMNNIEQNQYKHI